MTRRYNRSLEFYFNLAQFVGLIVFIAIFLASCDDPGVGKKEKETTDGSTTVATVRDLKDSDGCGLVLELENGEILVPFLRCGTPPLPEAYEFWYSKAKDGMKVSISYDDWDFKSTCPGKSIFLEYIKEVPAN